MPSNLSIYEFATKVQGVYWRVEPPRARTRARKNNDFSSINIFWNFSKVFANRNPHLLKKKDGVFGTY